MAVDPQLRRVVLSYRTQAALVRSRMLDFIRRAWGSLDEFRDADIDRFVAAVIPVVLAGQRQVVSLTDAYLAATAATVLGGPTRPTGIPALTIEELRGARAEEVYRRSGITVWTALKEGVTLAVAADRGLTRAIDLASTDLQLAKTHASREILGRDDRVVGYRRVLEGAKSCGLCAVAATQRYRVAELMPIHAGCDCGVQPIFGERDPGQVVNPDQLEGIHQTIAERFGRASESARGIPGNAADYRDVLVVHEHGELGPLLGVRGQVFTGPSDI